MQAELRSHTTDNRFSVTDGPQCQAASIDIGCRCAGDRLVRAAPVVETSSAHANRMRSTGHVRFAMVVNHVHRPAEGEGARTLHPTCVFAPYAATGPHGVGDRAARRVYMRCAECGVLPVTSGARCVSPKTRPAGGVWSGRLRCEGGNTGAVVCGGAVGDRRVSGHCR